MISYIVEHKNGGQSQFWVHHCKTYEQAEEVISGLSPWTIKNSLHLHIFDFDKDPDIILTRDNLLLNQCFNYEVDSIEITLDEFRKGDAHCQSILTPYQQNTQVTQMTNQNAPITNAVELKEAFIRAGRDHMFSDYDMLFQALSDPAFDTVELCDDNIFNISTLYSEFKDIDEMIDVYDYLQVALLDGDKAKITWFRDAGVQVLRNDKGVIISREF